MNLRNMKTTDHSGISLATADHIQALFEIEQRCFPGTSSYSKQQLKHLILHANSTCLVESQGGLIRAFLIVTYRRGSLTGHVETIDVDPTFQNQGIGLKLLKAAETDMMQRGMHWSQLELSEGNKTALELYRKAGYKFKEKIEGYYKYEHHGSRNAIRMVKALKLN
jgi:ribosomal protein S18 acetylase RimI-like enzyme